MDNQITDNDVSNCLKAIIGLGNVHVVDDTPDKYIRAKDDEDHIATLAIDGKESPLAIYGTKSPDALIINPFAEGQAGEIRNVWFYNSRNLILAAIVIRIIKKLLQVGVESHSKKKNAPTPSLVAIKYLEGSISDIDEKMIKEFETVSKENTSFLTIFYNKSKKQSEVSCVLKNKARRKQFTSIRTKTWNVFETLIDKVLGTSDLSDFAEGASTNGIPVLESYIKVLVKLYRAIEEPAQVVDMTFPQLAELESHIKYLPQYYTKARWCVSAVPATDTAAPVNSVAPWAVNTVATGNYGVPMTTAVPGVPMPTTAYVPQQAYSYGVPMAQPAVVPMQPVAVPGVPSASGVPLNGTTYRDMAQQQYMQQMMTAQATYGVPQPQAPQQAAYKSDNPFARP